MFTREQLAVIEYCAEECKRQGSGETSVYDMVNAWHYTTNFDKQEGMPEEYRHPKISLAFIQHIGKLVEPEDNKKGLRTIPIFVGNGFDMVEKAPADRIEFLLTTLIESYYEGNLEVKLKKVQDSLIGHTAISKSAEDQFYYEYENIHPFRDGNGRTGKIIYNYLCGTLDNPKFPPNFWGISNP